MLYFVSLLPGDPWGATLIFACYRGSDYIFGFKILNFAIFWGVKVLAVILKGMPI